MKRHRLYKTAIKTTLLLSVALASSGAALGAERGAGKQSTPETLANGASRTASLAALGKMHAYMKDRRDLKFSVSFSISDAVLGRKTSGQAAFDVRRPNLFRVEVKSKGQATTYVSDGTTLTIFKPASRKYTQMPARDTVLGTMYAAAGLLNVPARILDFFWTVDYLATVKEDVRTKTIANAQVGGRACLGLRVVRMEDQFDIWMQQTAPHLPCKLVSRRTDGGAETIHRHVFSWTSSPQFGAKFFQFAPPANAKKVDWLE